MWDCLERHPQNPMGYHHLAIGGYTPLSNTPRCEEIASVQASSNRNDNAKHMSLKMFTRTRTFGCRHHGCYWYCGNSSWIADYLPTHLPTSTSTFTSIMRRPTECQQCIHRHGNSVWQHVFFHMWNCSTLLRSGFSACTSSYSWCSCSVSLSQVPQAPEAFRDLSSHLASISMSKDFKLLQTFCQRDIDYLLSLLYSKS